MHWRYERNRWKVQVPEGAPMTASEIAEFTTEDFAHRMQRAAEDAAAVGLAGLLVHQVRTWSG